jgi:tight adherence protein C
MLLFGLPLALWILVAIGVGAVSIAAYAVLADRQRREVVGRTVLAGEDPKKSYRLLLGGETRREALIRRLTAYSPTAWKADEATKQKLIKAGFDRPTAPLTFAMARLTSLTVAMMLGALIAPKSSVLIFLAVVFTLTLVGYLGPIYWLERAMRLRQDRLRRSLADGVDLMVLCVEAGLGLDAAIVRVARETKPVHPDLSRELLVVSRKVNAGLSRGDALKAMYQRTGVDEVQVLVQNLIQSERLGSSVSKVLRVYAETLRRRRRQMAERRASVAPIKMTFPLAIMILPALFVVILGPAVLQIMSYLSPGR